MAPRFRFLPYLHDASDDPIFSVAGDAIYASFIPSAGNGGGMEISPTSLFSSTSTTTTASQSVSGSTVAVTSGGITINLLFDAAAMAAPASFRAGIQQAASILGAAIFDKITVNIQIDYSGTGGGAAAGPDNGLFESYSSIRTDLINHATPGETSFNALPSGSSIQGQSNVAVWNAQLKLWGFLGANDTTTDDGSATFATDINSSLLVGVALHELTHALGRIPYGSRPDIFDLFRFTGPGTRLFLGGATAPAAYFSVDVGNTKLADYGQTSDSSDFLNSGVQGPNDPFNEFYTSSTSQQLTAVDLKQMDVLGFHTSALDTQPPTLVTDNPLSIPAGTTQTITSSLLSVNDNISAGPQLHFTVTMAPTEGTLLLSGLATSSFTQVDINNGLVSYHETASGVTADSFLFTVTDAAGNATGTALFQINIVTPNHAPPDTVDFNGDGNTDLLFVNNTSNGVAVWLMNGVQVTANPQVGTMAAGWHYVAHGDFNADGKSDLLMLNDTTHDVAIWEMNGTQVVANQTIGTINATGGWHFADTGDFNGDGKTDLLMLNDNTNGVALWQMDGTQVTSNSQVGTLAAGWHYAAHGDFNADGKTDLLMLNDTTHDVAVWEMNGTQVVANQTIGTINATGGWHFADTGDFNGDGKTDLLMLNDITNGVALWQMNGTQVTANPQVGTINAAAGWHFADIGDFNGDGKSDLLMLNDTTLGVAIWQMNGTQVIANPQVGTIDPGFHYAGLGDFNGDHKTDLLFENDITHGLTVWEMNGAQIALNQQIGTINAAADWHLIA
jgi:Ser-tRNA(Ala) deacylase AlaX